MLSRRHAMKITLGSFVAALPLGPRAVAAIPADLDTPAVEVLDATDAPWWEGMSAYAHGQMGERPDLDLMGFWEWYEDELIDRVKTNVPHLGFTIDKNAYGFAVHSRDAAGRRDHRWLLGVSGPEPRTYVQFLITVDTDAERDALIGRIVEAAAQ